MRSPIRTLLHCCVAGAFGVSVLLTALRTSTTRPALRTERPLTDPALDRFAALMPQGNGRNLLGLVSQPDNPVLWTLLVAVLIAAGLHIARRSRRSPAPMRDRAQMLGLLGAAIWPWVLNPMPILGLLLAAASCASLIAGIKAGRRDRRRGMDDLPIGFIAGWLLMAATSALGMYVHHRLGMGLERAVLLGLLPAALLGAWGQLRIEGALTFSLALIWAMIGFAAATAGASITIATACVLGISALAVVLVRITT